MIGRPSCGRHGAKSRYIRIKGWRLDAGRPVDMTALCPIRCGAGKGEAAVGFRGARGGDGVAAF